MIEKFYLLPFKSVLVSSIYHYLSDYFSRWLAYKSFLSRFSVLMSHTMCSSNLFSASSCFQRFSWSRVFRVQVFLGPGFSGSSFFGYRFFRVQVFLSLGPGPRSRFQKQPIFRTAFYKNSNEELFLVFTNRNRFYKVRRKSHITRWHLYKR